MLLLTVLITFLMQLTSTQDHAKFFTYNSAKIQSSYLGRYMENKGPIEHLDYNGNWRFVVTDDTKNSSLSKWKRFQNEKGLYFYGRVILLPQELGYIVNRIKLTSENSKRFKLSVAIENSSIQKSKDFPIKFNVQLKLGKIDGDYLTADPHTFTVESESSQTATPDNYYIDLYKNKIDFNKPPDIIIRYWRWNTTTNYSSDYKLLSQGKPTNASSNFLDKYPSSRITDGDYIRNIEYCFHTKKDSYQYF